MSECTHLDMRDLLPDFVRGELTSDSSATLEAHLASCAACRAELRLVRDAHAVLAATPAVDAPRIADAIARSRGVRRDAALAVAETRRLRSSSVRTTSRRVWLAAAAIAAVATAVVLGSNGTRTSTSGSTPVIAQIADSTPAMSTPAGQGPVTTPRAPARDELVMGGGVSDLADADLESLLQALDDVDAELDVEPAVVMPVLEGDV